MAISDGGFNEAQKNASGFNEAQVIARLKEIFASTDPRISLGIGDDAAVVSGAKA
jgi:thiamine-monophosphate kinase